MSKILNFVKKYKTYFILSLVLVGVVLYFVFGRNSATAETYTVKKADISQTVLLSGAVQTSDKADLGFASSGRVASIFVKNNQSVAEGTVLAQLEIGDLLADLKIKEANLRTSDVDLEAAQSELDRVTKQQDAKVDSAYRNMLSSDLIMTAGDENSILEAPIVSGIYNGTSEGKYKVLIDKVNPSFTDYRVQTFGLEQSSNTIKKQSATSIGTKGLFISFDSNDAGPYLNTTWYIEIPNKSGASYVTNYNAYIEAKKARDLAVQEAEYKYKKLLTEGDNGSSTVAQAEIQKINAEIRKNTIYAPFSGKVTNIEKEVGENASVGERVVSILGENKLEVVLKVSELDVSRIPEGAPIDVTLDAFPTEVFHGVLKTINSRETTIDGVPVYEAFVEFAPDPRIKTGMSANGLVILAIKSDVLVVPTYLINKSAGVNTVEVIMADKKTEKRNVTLGLTGTDSMVEILSGLNEGDQVVPISK